MKSDITQLDHALKQRVTNAQPRDAWKQGLIADIEQRTQSRRWGWKVMLPVGVALIAVGVFATKALTDRDFVNTIIPASAGPFYEANQWTKDHVRYRFADGFELPTTMPKYSLEFKDFTRQETDEVVRHIVPVLLENGRIAQEDDDVKDFFRSYSNNENQTAYFEWYPETQEGYATIELFETPMGQAYREGDEKQLSPQEQQAVCEEFLQQQEWLYRAEQMECRSLNGVTAELLMTVDDVFTFTGLTFDFYNGELMRISGPLLMLNGVVATGTRTLPSEADIEAYVNANPPFHVMADFPDIAVEYVIDDYRFNGEGKLELHASIPNAEEVAQQLNIPKSNWLTEGTWTLIPYYPNPDFSWSEEWSR